MPRSKRIEFVADQKSLAYLEAERSRTGASVAEIIRRALAAGAGASNYKPAQETR